MHRFAACVRAVACHAVVSTDFCILVDGTETSLDHPPQNDGTGRETRREHMYTMAACRSDLAKLAAIVGLTAIAACSDLNGSGSHMVSLSVTTRSSTAPATVGSLGISNDITIGTGGELVLKKIQLVLARVEIARSDQAACADDDEDEGEKSGDDDLQASRSDEDDDCEDVSKNPILVNVPVDDAVHTVINVPLAAGTYKRLEAKLRPIDAAALAALGAPSDLAGNTIRVEGTFKGKAFVFTSPVRTNLELEFNPPLVVDGSTKNATVNIDVTKWFIGSNGTVIDPATANAGGPNAQVVAKNIRSSFKAFEDDDKRGDDDHEAEHRG